MRIKTNCPSCNGKGIYSGFAEGEDCAVVCSRCEGTGYSIEYITPFKKRLLSKNVKLVFEKNFGFGITKNSPGGMSYTDWLKGKKFSRDVPDALKKQICPVWYMQTIEDGSLNKFKQGCPGVLGAFDSCPKFKNKDACWKNYEKGKKKCK